MKKKIAIFMSAILILTLVIMGAQAESVVFSSLGKVANHPVFQELYGQICEMHRDHLNSRTDETAFLGDLGIETTKCVFDDDNMTFYLDLIFTNDDAALHTSAQYGIKITGNNSFEQIDDEIDENDERWVTINKYTEKECYETALEYFNSLRWNDPSSVTVYGHTVGYGAGTYIYSIDYSAKNKLGGTNREFYVIEVDAAINTVISGMSL